MANFNDVKYLYHATFGPLLEYIENKGLGNTKITQYEDSKPGVVYLAFDPDVAVSYCEANDRVDEDWLDDIYVLEIPINKLDKSKLFIDNNVKLDEDKEASTVEYHGVIPWSSISVILKV